MDEIDNNWTEVSRKTQKPQSKLYKLDGTKLTDEEIVLNREIKKQYQSDKKNKKKKYKSHKLNEICDREDETKESIEENFNPVENEMIENLNSLEVTNEECNGREKELNTND